EVTDTLPSYEGENNGFSLVSDQNGSYVKVAVEEGTEATGKDGYIASLINNEYKTYGANRYISKNDQIIVTVYSGTSGFVIISFEKNPFMNAHKEFPLEELNAFLTANSMGFTFQENLPDSSGMGYLVSIGQTDSGYNTYKIVTSGNQFSTYVEFIEAIIIPAGYTKDEFSSSSSPSYSNENWSSVILYYDANLNTTNLTFVQ
nr:hypothetical protein [Bacilli bacterium]